MEKLVDIKAKYIHDNENIELELKKRVSDDLYILVPAGYYFDSDSQKRQDLIIVSSKHIVFKSDKMTVHLKGYCSQASKGAPRKGDTYQLAGFHPDSNLVKLAQFIDSMKLFNGDIQHAIWAISDKKNPSSIKNDNIGKILRKHVSEANKTDTTWYEIEYFNNVDSNQSFSDKHKKLTGDVQFYMGYPSLITILVRDIRGQVVQYLENKYLSQGKHEYEIELEIKDWPKGKYEVLIYEDQHVFLQKYNIEI